jgi:hypothetical protein
MPRIFKKSKKNEWLNLLSPRTAVALAALIVSICSLVLTVSQMNSNKKSQYLSVLPYVTCGMTKSILNENGTGSFSMIIQNKGIGPAFLHSVRIKSRDKFFEAYDYAKAIQYYTQSEKLPYYAFSTIAHMDIIPAKEQISWFRSLDEKEAYPFLKKIFAGDNGFIVYICFGDVYGRTWTVDSFNDKIEPCDECPILQ